MNAKKVIIVIFCILIFTFCYCQDYWESIFEYEESIRCVETNYLGFIYIGALNGIYISVDNCISWNEVIISGVCGSIISDADTLYASMLNSIYKSIDFGISWEQTGFPSTAVTIFKDSHNNLFAGNWGEIYKSNDSGENWVLVLSNTNTEVINDFAETSDGLFAATTNFTGEGGVYRSIDQGDNWELIGLNYHFLSSLAVNSNNELFAGGRGHYYQGIGGVYRSSDNGETWVTLTNNFYVNDIIIDSQDRIFFGGSDYTCMVWMSEDNGETWQQIETQVMPEYTEITDLTITNDDYIYAISYGGLINEVFRSVESTGTNSHFEIPNAELIKLSNYPNPFNPTTTISFSLNTKTTKDIELLIYNLKGQKIREYSISNNHSSIVWNGKDDFGNSVSSGIYFYKLKSGNFVQSRKMLLLK